MLRAEERQLQLMTSLVGVEVIVCGSDMGEVMSASVKGDQYTPRNVFMYIVPTNCAGVAEKMYMKTSVHVCLCIIYCVYIHIGMEAHMDMYKDRMQLMAR